jgi:dUTP pyrophosphatase
MKVLFKKLKDGARLPKKATVGSAAYDLYTAEDITIKQGRQIIPLWFAMEMEEGYEALIDPRSGFSSKGMEGYHTIEQYKVSMRSPSLYGFDNYPRLPETEAEKESYISTKTDRFDCDVIEGKIDSDYRDGVGVIVCNRDSRTFLIKAGTRIAQMTFHKVETVEWEEVEKLSETDREGGFGSTGVK